MSRIAVLDCGKTNIKLHVATEDGVVLETLSTRNPSLPGPPYVHHDLAGVEGWLLSALAQLAARHAIAAIVPCGHGSGGVLVGPDGPVLPMMDYEQPTPAEIDAEYRALSGSFLQRGSAVMGQATHTARQLLWMQRGWPDAVGHATAFLALPQYWAWRLSGVAASEVSSLGAQSGLWDVIERRPGPIVAACGWSALLPPTRPAWSVLGTLHPELASRTGLDAATRIVCGVHDSTANLYRYQAGGLADAAIVSTGTWIVALNPSAPVAALDEARGMTCNADVFGSPAPGALLMGGRAFSRIAGDGDGSAASTSLAAGLIARGTFAVGHDALGGIAGPLPEDAATRRTLAVLQMALLTDLCLATVESTAAVVLDGSFVADPLYAALVAALRPGQDVRVNASATGLASGAALLVSHASRTQPVALSLDTPQMLDLPALPAYRRRWIALTHRTD